MKTKKFKYKPEFEFDLIGISSPLDDYKTIWTINNNTNLDFKRGENLSIRNNKYTEIQEFSTFFCKHKDTDDKIVLVANKCSNGFLIEELKNIDFFILFYSKKLSNEISKIVQTLKKQEDIIAVIKIDPSTLKSKEKLLF